ncbi:adenosine deaminase [Komagataeibacter medellinensis]|uniref:adenosine deaminase n=1 Tax=Komagataeibacter medellinensis TaxID=1177712 RepID=A0ABQ6VWQ4_9PROT|nr:adenosine deaminase [Komagataeibacter medellinensis]KAB8124546.1 adenosine deaminase [Komagataeibacter medellinensis]
MRLRSLLLLCAVVSLPVHVCQAQTADEQKTARIFSTLQSDSVRLSLFMRQFPKGADLHNHLVGAIYAESYLKWAAQDGLCVMVENGQILSHGCTGHDKGGIPAAMLPADVGAENSMIDALSMRDFVPTAKDRSGHDHFFAAFRGFDALTRTHAGDSLAEARDRAALDHVHYIELMVSPGLGGMIAAGNAHQLRGEDYAQAEQALRPLLPRLVADARRETDEMEQQAQRTLQCGTPQAHAGCGVKVHYLYQTLRIMQPSAVFAQLYAGYEVVRADPRFVGVNIVCPEDDTISMRDYDQHMRMFQALNAQYPDIKLSLHAGELTPGLVPPEGLDHHIRGAVEVANARRIGHGVDIEWERDATELLAEMARKKVMVEINLTSNDVILNVKGRSHPFVLYRQAGVPVALSTDDEGVSRGDLTQEYLRAATTWPLSYQEMKELSRNGLTYSFIPGESLWTDGHIVPACQDMMSKSCHDFATQNEKAGLQIELENNFIQFEATVAHNPLLTDAGQPG